MQRQVPRLCAVILLCLLGAAAHAYMFMGSRLRSPLMVHNGRLLFIQGDGSLTALDMETGAVEKRLRPPSGLEAVRFEMHGDDILGIDSRGLFMLDGDSGDLKWQRKGVYPLRQGGLFVFSDGNHTLSAVDAATGGTAWEINLGGYVEFDAADGVVYGRCNFHADPKNRDWFLTAVDAATGKELWRKQTPPGEFWGLMRCTGDGVFVLAGPLGEDRYDTRFDRIRAWTRDGEQLPDIAPGPGVKGQPHHQLDGEPLVVDGVELPPRRIIHQEPERRALTPDERRRIGSARADSGLALDGGGVVVLDVNDDHHPWRDDNRLDRRLHFLDGETGWSGVPAYMNLHSRNTLETAASTADRVVVVSRLGHVECLDRKTGRSRWLYVFPTLRPELSGPHKWKPAHWNRGFYTDSLRRYRAETAGVGIAGTTVDGDPLPPEFRIIADPDPVDYYGVSAKFGKGISILITAFTILMALAGSADLYYFLAKRKPTGFMAKLDARESPGTMSTLCMSTLFMSLLGYYFFGRYSLLTSVCLKLVAAAMLCLGIYKLTVSLWGEEGSRSEKLGTLLGFLLLFAMSAFIFILIVGGHF